MKKALTYIITLIALSVAVASCADDYFDKSQVGEGCINMTLLLNLPGNNAQTRSNTNATADEEKIESVHILVFEGGKLQEEITDIKEISTATGKMTLGATTSNSYKSSIEVILLANLGKDRGAFNANEYFGKTEKEIYQTLVFDYTTPQWNISTQAIPMWGAITLVAPKAKNNISVSLFRALGKVNIYVNEGVENFTLTSARIYYTNDRGYSAPLVKPTGDEITTPSIPTNVEQFDKEAPLVYEIKDPMSAIENRIYIPEANNKAPGTGKKAVCIVVGGKYTGNGLVESGKESFYRIDLKDKDDKSVYDVLRNHLYNFTINSVDNPGTPTPEDALESVVVAMNVTIEAWNETTLRSISDQYSLVTDKSRVSFNEKGEAAEGETAVVTVWSDFGEDWKIVDVTGGLTNGWYKLNNVGGQISITTKANYGASRTGSFYIQSGKLKKQIIVEQSQPGTANCYVVGGGDQQLSVIIKGNGTQGLYADGDNGSRKELDQTAVLETEYVSVIWETKKGLITLKSQGSGGSPKKAQPNEETGILTYNVDIAGASVDGKSGGNALIGAFDKNDKLIWSWHIWVCPEIASTGYKDEDWTLTGYHVMDRNLGAISNKPGIASLGLLYQWGRKDPFIGAATIDTTAVKMNTENYLNYAWDVAGNENNKKTVAYTIEHPTQLIQDGLSVSEKEKGAYLWGTNGGLQEGIKELGTKTIYDPCPVGYRVPPVDAFVFKGTVDYVDQSGSLRNFGDDLEKSSEKVEWEESFTTVTGNYYVLGRAYIWYEGQSKPTKPVGPIKIPSGSRIKKGAITTTYTLRKSSETKNWEENLVYIPNNLYGAQGNWSMYDYLYDYSIKPITDATYYGYYINYQEVRKPKMKSPAKDYYTIENEETVTWMPLSGAYDPVLGMTFKGVTIEQGPSLTVNSFIWTNSSITSDGTTRPGALFLHGANPKKIDDGRHIHALIKSDIKAEPRYAGAVRCVRDTKKVFTADNKAPTTIEGEAGENSVEGEIRAINDSWKVIDPGAPWFTISPDHAGADKNRGTKISFNMKANSAGTPRSAIVKIQFSGEKEPREIEVSQK